MLDKKFVLPPEYRVCYVAYSDDKSEQSSNGVITIVTREIGTGRYVYGVAVCRPGDHFCKSDGRFIAFDRAERYRNTNHERFGGEIKYLGGKRYSDVKMMVIIDMLANMQPELQEWAITALQSEMLENMTKTFLLMNE